MCFLRAAAVYRITNRTRNDGTSKGIEIISINTIIILGAEKVQQKDDSNSLNTAGFIGFRAVRF